MALYRGACKLAGIGKAESIVYKTQDEYDCLPSSKLTDGNSYGIYESSEDTTLSKFIRNGVEYSIPQGGGSGSSTYGDGSDGDLVITEDTILNAGQQYQFKNLTICSGATVSFSGNGGAKIKVADTFINHGTIDTTDIDVDMYEYRDSTSFCMICNCSYGGFEYGKGGAGGYVLCYVNCCEACRGGNGGCACECPGSGGICCNGSGGYGGNTSGSNGGIGYMCGGGGGGGAGFCSKTNGCAGSGFDGGNGGDGGFCNYMSIGGGGGGGGGFYTGNGGNGGSFRGNGTYCNSAGWNCPFRDCMNGGGGGNGGILGNGGNGGGCCMYEGGRGGDGGDGVCGGKGGYGGKGCATCCYGEVIGRNGGNGGKGYYGGEGGHGGDYCMACANSQMVSAGWKGAKKSGDGGKGGQGIVPGKGGKGGAILCNYMDATVQGCMNGQIGAGSGGQGGTGCSRLHSLNIKAKCFCNLGCILSVGATGGQGGDGGDICGSGTINVVYAGTGGQGGAGGQGGMIQIITENALERGCISVAGGVGGQGGEGGTHQGCPAHNGASGAQGPIGESGTLYFFELEG